MKKRILVALLPALLGCFLLCGCMPTDYDASEKNSETDRGIAIAKEWLAQNEPDAMIIESSFETSDVRNDSSPKLRLTDWVIGEYKNGGRQEIAVNLKTNEIYTSEEVWTLTGRSQDLIEDLCGLDANTYTSEVNISKEVPSIAGDDSYPPITLYDMLPAGDVVDDAYIEDFRAKGEYLICYLVWVKDDVDASLFEGKDYSVLGSNAYFQVTKEGDEAVIFTYSTE